MRQRIPKHKVRRPAEGEVPFSKTREHIEHRSRECKVTVFMMMPRKNKTSNAMLHCHKSQWETGWESQTTNWKILVDGGGVCDMTQESLRVAYS